MDDHLRGSDQTNKIKYYLLGMKVEFLELKVTTTYIKKRILPVIESTDVRGLFDLINTLKERLEDEVADTSFFIIPQKKT